MVGRVRHGAILTMAAVFVLAGACGEKLEPGAGNGTAECTAAAYSTGVEPLLGAHCVECHASSKSGAARNGAPSAVDFDSYDAATANAARANARIQAGTMPPSGALTPDEQALFQTWLDLGTPRDPDPLCDQSTGPDAAATDAGADVSQDIAACEIPGWEPTVRTIFESACVGCHATSLSGAARNGAPPTVNFDSYAAAVASAAPANIRIQAGTMPPGAPLSSTDRNIVRAWLEGDTPETGGTPCGQVGDPDAGPSAETTGPSAPGACQSGSFWTDALTEGDRRMNPGLTCVACHAETAGAPTLVMAGTVFSAFDEPDRCQGVEGAVVVITDDADKEYRLETNASGNFLVELTGTDERERPEHLRVASPPTWPIRVRVEYEGRTREMSAAQMTGDCNACHTWQGQSGAPGRVVVP